MLYLYHTLVSFSFPFPFLSFTSRIWYIPMGLAVWVLGLVLGTHAAFAYLEHVGEYKKCV
jgi:hypothetical protein